MSQHEPDTIVTELSPSSSSTVEAMVRGEVDVQISTAKRYPRSIKQFRSDALSMATLDEETASSCFYSLPRGGKPIEGPSARLAEIVASSWGNMRVQAYVAHTDDKYVTARGVAWDLEKNVAIGYEVRRRITDKHGRKLSDDMIGVTSNAACSIALRNAVFKVVPMAFVRPIYAKAREVAIGDVQTLSARRSSLVEYFGKMGIRPEQIAARVDRASVEDITLDDLGTLKGLAQAIKDGDTSIDEAFASAEPAATDKPAASKTDRLADAMKKNGGAEPLKTPVEPTPEQVQETAAAAAAQTKKLAESEAKKARTVQSPAPDPEPSPVAATHPGPEPEQDRQPQAQADAKSAGDLEQDPSGDEPAAESAEPKSEIGAIGPQQVETYPGFAHRFLQLAQSRNVDAEVADNALKQCVIKYDVRSTRLKTVAVRREILEAIVNGQFDFKTAKILN